MPASTGAKNPRAHLKKLTEGHHGAEASGYTNMELDYWNGIGTGIVGTIGYVVLPTGVSTDVSRDIV